MNAPPAPAEQPIFVDELAAAAERVFGAPRSGPTALRLSTMRSPVGELLLAEMDDALCTVAFVGVDDLEAQLQALRRRSLRGAVVELSGCLEQARRQLEEYFAGQRARFDLALTLEGTAFQQKVWNALLEIPYGETWSYLKLAERIGDARATRAVGMANNANPVAIIVPCHRVVNANGALGGYGGGLWRKRVLLDLEMGQHFR